MTARPFARGCVVARGPMCSVVWSDGAAGLELLPIIRPRRFSPYDVAVLELAELVAIGGGEVPAGSVIRPRVNAPVSAGGWRAIGAVPGVLMCRVVVELVRAEAARTCCERWAGDAEHKRRARDERAVNLVAA